MYVSFNGLRNYELGGDEVLGNLADIYLDERDWTTLFFVVETGGWFSSNKVLVGKSRVTAADPAHRQLKTGLTKAELEAAPPASTEKTVGDVRRAEWALDANQSLYLAGMHSAVLPAAMYLRYDQLTPETGLKDNDPVNLSHLRSCTEMLGYGVHAPDENFGSVSDLLFDVDSWKLAYFTIDTGNWLPGKLVVIAPDWVNKVSWRERCLDVKMSKKQIEDSPPLAELSGLKKSFENELYNYYGYPML